MTFGLGRRGRRPASGKPYGVIDIGSNSLRLVIVEELTRSPTQVYNEKIECALARDMVQTGHLNAEGVARALITLERFRIIAEHYETEHLDVVATAAVRDASDREVFLTQARDRIAQPIRILSESEEGEGAALGVLSDSPMARGIVGDLGGGSLELVRVGDGAISNKVSRRLGVLRLVSMFGDDTDAIEAHVRTVLQEEAWLAECAGQSFYTVGSSWRNFARIRVAETDYPLRLLQGYAMEAEEVFDVASRLTGPERHMLKDRLVEIEEKVPMRRFDYMVQAATVLKTLMALSGAARVVVSAAGLREGLIYGQVPADVQRRDPLVDTATRMAGRMARAIIDDEKLADWIEPLFADRSTVPDAGRAAHLRRVAAILGDIGWRVHPDYRARESGSLVLRAGLPSLSHGERAYLALALWYRYTRSTPEGQLAEVQDLLPKSRLDEAKQLGMALRLALELTGGAPGLLSYCRLTVEGPVLRLSLRDGAHSLVTDSISKRIYRLARAMGRRYEIVKE